MKIALCLSGQARFVEQCYNEVLYHADLLHKINTNLINFESDEVYNYFIFRKETKKDSLFLGAYSLDKNKILKAVVDIENSSLYKDNFIPLHLFCDNNLWLDKEFTEKLPRFTINCIFTRAAETGFENNENVYNWNRVINVCRTKKLLLINDDFNMQNFSLDVNPPSLDPICI